MARQVFNRLYPWFESLDPKTVIPMIAPVPLMIITGARDSQFRTSGVTEVDEAAQAAYKEYGVPFCSELLVQARSGHTISRNSGYVAAAFFDRWLK